MASIDKETAALRWLGYEITGDGRIAVVYECCRKVVLVQTPLEGQVLQQERCSRICSHHIVPDGAWHKVHKLDRKIEPRYEPVFVSKIWERD
jgi:hypothetical protein